MKSVLEIGCGTGLYPIEFKDLFERKKYLGVDLSETAIKHCKKNSDYEFICGDFVKIPIEGVLL